MPKVHSKPVPQTQPFDAWMRDVEYWFLAKGRGREATSLRSSAGWRSAWQHGIAPHQAVNQVLALWRSSALLARPMNVNLTQRPRRKAHHDHRLQTHPE